MHHPFAILAILVQLNLNYKGIMRFKSKKIKSKNSNMILKLTNIKSVNS